MKKKYLVATHGELAKGFQSSLEVLAGRGKDIEVINAYVTDEDYTPQVTAFMESLTEDQQGIVFTDLFGGSVNQKIVTEMVMKKKENIFVISNANLAIILSLLFISEEQPITEAFIKEAITESQVQLVQVTNSKEESIF